MLAHGQSSEEFCSYKSLVARHTKFSNGCTALVKMMGGDLAEGTRNVHRSHCGQIS